MIKNNNQLPQWALDQLGKLREIYNTITKGDDNNGK